jgi:ubiquinone/menaquinone biosynthesis C-methylase UbiE
MTTGNTSPSAALDRIKFLVGGIFSTALYLRHNWSSLHNQPYYAARMVASLDALKDSLPAELIMQVKSLVDPLEGFSVQPDIEAAQAYQEWASSYDQAVNPLILVEEPHVRDLLGDVRGKWVADIACGTGRHSRYAVEQGAAVVHGVDFSAGMLGVAREHNLKVAQSLTESIPLPSGRYDAAVCALALEHVENLRPSLHEMARILKPGGSLVISDFHPALLLVGSRSGIRNYVHTVADYITPLVEAGMTITAMREPKVGELPDRFPRTDSSFAKLLAHMPFVLIIKATKQ